MFEDSILDSGDKGKKALRCYFHDHSLSPCSVVLILIPSDFTDSWRQPRYLMRSCAPPPPAASAAAAGCSVAATEPVQVKPVQIDPGAMVAPTEIPKEIAKIVDEPDCGCCWWRRWWRCWWNTVEALSAVYLEES